MNHPVHYYRKICMDYSRSVGLDLDIDHPSEIAALLDDDARSDFLNSRDHMVAEINEFFANIDNNG